MVKFQTFCDVGKISGLKARNHPPPVGHWSHDQFCGCVLLLFCSLLWSSSVRYLERFHFRYLSLQSWRTDWLVPKVASHYQQIMSEMQEVMFSLSYTVKLPPPFYCASQSITCSCAIIFKKMEEVTWPWRYTDDSDELLDTMYGISTEFQHIQRESLTIPV